MCEAWLNLYTSRHAHRYFQQLKTIFLLKPEVNAYTRNRDRWKYARHDVYNVQCHHHITQRLRANFFANVIRKYTYIVTPLCFVFLCDTWSLKRISWMHPVQISQFSQHNVSSICHLNSLCFGEFSLYQNSVFVLHCWHFETHIANSSVSFRS